VFAVDSLPFVLPVLDAEKRHKCNACLWSLLFLTPEYTNMHTVVSNLLQIIACGVVWLAMFICHEELAEFWRAFAQRYGKF
jgi:hypothetical protein